MRQIVLIIIFFMVIFGNIVHAARGPLPPLAQQYLDQLRDKKGAAVDETEKRLGWFDISTFLWQPMVGTSYYVNISVHAPDFVLIYTDADGDPRWPADAVMVPVSLRDLGIRIIPAKGHKVPDDGFSEEANGYILTPAPGVKAPYKLLGNRNEKGDVNACHLWRPQFYPEARKGWQVVALARPDKFKKDGSWDTQETRDIRLAWLVNPKTGAIRGIDPRDVRCTIAATDYDAGGD